MQIAASATEEAAVPGSYKMLQENRVVESKPQPLHFAVAEKN
jgi:hypothetical protein